MQKVALVLAGLTCAGYGRRLQHSIDSSESHPDVERPEPTSALAVLLQELNASAAFHPLAQQAPFSTDVQTLAGLRSVFLDGQTHLLPVVTRLASQVSSSDVESRPKIIICGAPASGKGTQCEMLKEKYGVVHLSTGDMLRAAVAEGTDVGLKAKSYMESGQLVPDDVIIGIVKDRLAQEDCERCGWLLDGFPRTEEQAKALGAAGIEPNSVLYLDVPDEMLIERVVGRRSDPETGKIYHLKFNPPPTEDIAARLTQRADDTEEKARVRLDNFHQHMGAVEAVYKDLITKTDGTKAKEEVFKALQEALD